MSFLDIFDKELNDLRKYRWNRAFSNESEQDELHNDLRATIVIEHIIQAADVAHTVSERTPIAIPQMPA